MKEDPMCFILSHILNGMREFSPSVASIRRGLRIVMAKMPNFPCEGLETSWSRWCSLGRKIPLCNCNRESEVHMIHCIPHCDESMRLLVTR